MAGFLHDKHYSTSNLIGIRTQFHELEQVHCTPVRDVPDLYLGQSTDYPTTGCRNFLKRLDNYQPVKKCPAYSRTRRSIETNVKTVVLTAVTVKCTVVWCVLRSLFAWVILRLWRRRQQVSPERRYASVRLQTTRSENATTVRYLARFSSSQAPDMTQLNPSLKPDPVQPKLQIWSSKI